MKRIEVVLVLSCWLLGVGSAAAQDGLAFTLEEADAAQAKHDRGARSKAEIKKPAQEESNDAKAAIAEALGELRWGMSKSALLKMIKAQIRADFDQRIKVERDIVRQDALYQQAQERYRRINDNFFVFDGQKTGWDVSPVADEFRHGTGETMLVITHAGSRDLYFFMHDKLWKWYRELAPAAAGDDPDAALEAINERFGRGKPQRDRASESKTVYAGTTWTDGSTRVTALRRGNDSCLIFEDGSVLDKLAELRHGALPRGGKATAASVIDSVLMSEAELRARQ